MGRVKDTAIGLTDQSSWNIWQRGGWMKKVVNIMVGLTDQGINTGISVALGNLHCAVRRQLSARRCEKNKRGDCKLICYNPGGNSIIQHRAMLRR